MKKYYGLSATEEKTLRYLDFFKGWTDIIGSVSLVAGLIASAFWFSRTPDVKKFGEFFLTGDKLNFYTLVSVWIITSLIVIRTGLGFAAKYLESKVVADYEGTEGIEG